MVTVSTFNWKGENALTELTDALKSILSQTFGADLACDDLQPLGCFVPRGAAVRISQRLRLASGGRFTEAELFRRMANMMNSISFYGDLDNV
ncbi:hypothetical protein SODG_006078 [Sodalis praecaptivus]